MNNLSQTQLSTVMSVAGMLVILANQFGIILEKEETTFVLAAVWTLGWNGYNYIQRYRKGDLSLGGLRK